MDNQVTVQETAKTKFCKHCGARIPEDAVLCTACGRQVEEVKQSSSSNTQPNIVINNANSNVNQNNNMLGYTPKPKNRWVALLLCFFFGIFGAHKFYEGKIGMGILYLFTGGLFIVGCFIDFIAILFKPTVYYVR